MPKLETMLKLTLLLFPLTFSTLTFAQEKTEKYFLDAANNAYDQGDFTVALDNYSKAIEKKPNNFQTYLDRGITYSELDRFDEAIKDFNKCLSLSPKNDMAYFNIGYALFSKEKFTEALSIMIPPSPSMTRHRSIFCQREIQNWKLMNLRKP